MRLTLLAIIAALFAIPLAAQPAAAPPATTPATADAWPFYDKAARRVRENWKLGKTCPTRSDIPFSHSYPPFSALWDKTAKEACEVNASALEAVHQATAFKVAQWPVVHEEKGKGVLLPYLGDMRMIANEVADAAMYDHVHGNDLAALQRIEDLLHLADLLDESSDVLGVQAHVAIGIRALAFERLQVIATELRLTREPPQKEDAAQLIPVETVRSLIKQFFTLDDPTLRAKDLIEHEKVLYPNVELHPETLERLNENLRRDQMERNLTAMALACQIVRFDKGHWPASLDELLPDLPAPPADAWGKMGYALIKNGRPDGSHRPVVYSRRGVGEGAALAYPSAEPKFCYYNYGSFGNTQIPIPGQFRDVSLWPPTNLPAGLKQLR